MKKTVAVLLALMLLICLAACSGRQGGEVETTSAVTTTEQPETTSSPETLFELSYWDHWAYPAIIELYGRGLIKNLAAFDPDVDAKRCDFINMFLGAVVSPDLAGIKGGLFDSAEAMPFDSAVEMITSALKLKETPSWLTNNFVGLPSVGNSGLTNAECAVITMRIIENIVEEGNDPLEIERKFLINRRDLPFDTATATPYNFVQTYINISPEVRVRAINDSEFWFAVKLPKDEIGLSRQEVQFTITAEEYSSLMEKKEGSSIIKTRYYVTLNGIKVAIDIYREALAGLSVAEIQFESVEKANDFKPYNWFGKDVTSDKRYKNASLAMDGLPE